MSQPEKSLRVRRTHKLLREAIIELIEERGFDALTVGEIADRALISRAAFYRNYKDKYELVEQIFEEAMSSLQSAVADFGREHPPQVWVKFLEHIAAYARLYRALLGKKGSPWFVIKMRGAMTDLIKAHGQVQRGLKGSHRTGTAFADEFVPDLVSTLFVEAIIWWLEHDRPYTPKEMATRCSLLVSALFKEASTWQ